MKKSLILSVVMTLVLVISMSTATFAWYSANSTVTATVAEITASSAGGSLTIGMEVDGYEATGGDYAKTVTLSGVIDPACPLGELTSYTGRSFVTGSNDLGSNSHKLKKCQTSNAISGTITINNNSASSDDAQAVSVKLTEATISNTSVPLSYVVFDSTGAVYATNGYNYLSGTYPNDNITIDAAAFASSYVAVDSKDGVAFTVTKGIPTTLNFVVWFDGYSMQDSHQGQASNITFLFGIVENTQA